MNELAKVKYHIGMLADALDLESFPVESMIISFDFSEDQVKQIHDIFGAYSKKIEKKQ